jgi:phosphate-selective porin OprO/OprP
VCGASVTSSRRPGDVSAGLRGGAGLGLGLLVALVAGSAGAETPSPVGPDNVRYEPGKGVSFRSDDDRFLARMKVRGQILQTTVGSPGVDPTLALEIRRARFAVTGHLLGPHFKYKLELAFSPRDEGLTGSLPPLLSASGTNTSRPPLLDWYVDLTWLRDLNVRAGQYKIGFSRQRVLSSGSMQLVDRSVANGEFNLDRDVGVDVRSKDLFGLGLLRYVLGVSIGEGHSAFRFPDAGVMVLGRVELHPLGFFDDAFVSDLERLSDPKLALSVAWAHLGDGKGDRGVLGRRPADGNTTDFHVGSADLLVKWAGASLLLEGFLRDGRRNGTPAPGETLAAARDGLGWMAQGGALLPGVDVELVGRYSEVRPLGEASALSRAHELVAGVNWFLDGHRVKLQADYTRAWGEAGLGEGSDRVRVQLEAGL